jgi:hypothetical protein
MKRFAASAAALIFLATAAPVLAQDRDDRYNRDNSGWNQRDNRDNRDYHDHDRNRDRYNRDYYRDRRGHEWREGDMYQGHRLTYYNGRWGYWQPRNGTQVFVQFWL